MDATTIICAIIASGFFNTLLSSIVASKKEKRNDLTSIKKALALLMKEALKLLCESYIKRGYITTDELEEIVSMHKVYHDGLGGNGYLDALMHEVHLLDVKVAEVNVNE